jgi:type VI protein secretion system component Hcp
MQSGYTDSTVPEMSHFSIQSPLNHLSPLLTVKYTEGKSHSRSILNLKNILYKIYTTKNTLPLCNESQGRQN